MKASPQLAALESLRIGRIDLIEERTVRLPFVKPFATSNASWSCKEAILLRIEGEGASGWGECVADPDPFYSPETTVTVHHILKDFLLPLLEPGITLAELEQRFRQIRGHAMAKATLENALLDWIARMQGLPLHQLLGYPRRPIPSGISIGIQDSIDDLLVAVAEAVAAGYHRIKLKIQPGKDLQFVGAVRSAFPAAQLMVDANGAYRLEDAEHLRRLDRFGLTMIEQPLSYSDIYQHSILARQLETPLCLDESIHNLEDAEAAIALGGCRILNLKQGRVGGLLESLRILDFAAARGVSVWSGGMDETGIGRAVNIHLQSHPAYTLPGDTSETRRYFHEDIVAPAVELDAGGFIAIPEGPGIGVRLVEDVLAKVTQGIERLYP